MKSRLRNGWLLFVIVVALAGCKDNHAAKNADSTAISRSLSPPITGSGLQTGWDSSAGPVMVIASSRSPTDVAIVLPGLTDSVLATTSHFELRGLTNIPLDLFNSRGLVGNSTLQVASQSSDSAGCISWPSGKVMASAPVEWRIALEKGRAIGLPLDSMEGMTGADSAQFVASVVATAISLTSSADAVFSGIPFFVRKGYRLTIPSGSIIIAEAVRRINEEANPREEHLLLVAERSNGSSEYRPGFHARSAGSEESLETSEILSALRLTKTNRLAIVITFEHEEGGKIGLLERLAPNDWRVVWKSAYTGC